MLRDAWARKSGCNTANGVTCGPIVWSSFRVPWNIGRTGQTKQLQGRGKTTKSQQHYHMPVVRLIICTAVQSYLVPNLDLVRVLPNVGVYGLFDQVAFAACNPQDQIVKRAAAQNIHVVAGARPAARAEAIRLVSHLHDLHRDLRWIVARHAPAAIAHVAGRK
jgi:hypothetical protein